MDALRKEKEVGAMLAQTSSTTSVFTGRTPSKLGAYLDDIIFPCSRAEILRCAEENEAPDIILDAIENLPDKHFSSITDIVTRLQKTA